MSKLLHHHVLSCFVTYLKQFSSRCSHAQVLWTALVHEFHIFYNYSEWNCLRGTKIHAFQLGQKNKLWLQLFQLLFYYCICYYNYTRNNVILMNLD